MTFTLISLAGCLQAVTPESMFKIIPQGSFNTSEKGYQGLMPGENMKPEAIHRFLTRFMSHYWFSEVPQQFFWTINFLWQQIPLVLPFIKLCFAAYLIDMPLRSSFAHLKPHHSRCSSSVIYTMKSALTTLSAHWHISFSLKSICICS